MGEELKIARSQLTLSKSLVTIRPSVAVTIGEKADLWIASYKTIDIFEIKSSGGYSLKHKLEVGMAGSFITCMAKSTAGKYVFTGHNDSKIGQFFFVFCFLFWFVFSAAFSQSIFLLLLYFIWMLLWFALSSLGRGGGNTVGGNPNGQVNQQNPDAAWGGRKALGWS